jgi:hypothetical protein
MSESRGPHIPHTTVAGHFLSMQPVDFLGMDITKVWYPGPQFIEIYDLMDKYRHACESIQEIFNDPNETGDSDSLIKILDIIEKVLA